MDIEIENLRPKYSLCRAGFLLMAISLGLACLSRGCTLVSFVTINPALTDLLRSSFWTWGVGAPITWAALIGSYLLWGRWTEPEWQRRAGLLVLMNAIDLVTWFVEHRGAFGLAGGQLQHDWLIFQVTELLQWCEMLLITGLATDLILHFGEEQQPEISRAAQSLAMIGLGLTVVYCLLQTDWTKWPLQPLRRGPGVMMFLGSLLLMTMATFQVTALCILAARRCGDYLRELEKHAGADDLVGSQSESKDPWYGA
jgi:hypothetical protein